MTQAFSSTVNLSFAVRGGLLMRQMHHWACDIFVGAIVVHMARVFFTGAFRKPRELNWTIGTTLLILAIVNGFLGYSLPDDLVSGTGIRIAYSIILSIPLVGSYLGFWVFGGNFPGTSIHSAVLYPPLFDRAVDHHRTGECPPLLARATEAHAVPRRRPNREECRRFADVPGLHGQDGLASSSSSPVSRRCSVPSRRSTRSGSSGHTTRRASPTPCNRTGTWASSTAHFEYGPRGRSIVGAIRSRSRS